MNLERRGKMSIHKTPIFDLFNKVDHCKTKDEILEDGEINYEVEKVDQFITVDEEGGESFKIINPFTRAVYRPSTQKIIGTVGVKFGLIQNSEVVDFADVFSVNGDAEFHAAIAPNLGERIFILMKQPQWVDLGGGDSIHSYFCITSAHDGTGCFNAIPLYLRSVGQLVITPPYTSSALKIKHTKNAMDRLSKSKALIMKLGEYFEDYTDSFKNFATLKLTDERARDYFKLLVPGDKTRSENVRERLWDLYKISGAGCKLPTCQDTLLGAMMAVMENAEYYSTVKESQLKDQVAARIHSRLSGSAAELKARAILVSQKMYDAFGGGKSILQNR